MQRVVIAPGVATVGLGFLTFFAVGGLLIAGLMMIGAEAIAKQSQGSAMNVRIGAAVIGVVAAWVLVTWIPQWGAIAVIDKEEDGWRLVDRRGRASKVKAGTDVEIALRCRRVVFTTGGVPRIQDVVDGTIHGKRLAPSGRVTYGRVLQALGAEGEAPARGESRRYRVRV